VWERERSRMARDDGAELESLKREVEYLRSEHVALRVRVRVRVPANANNGSRA